MDGGGGADMKEGSGVDAALPTLFVKNNKHFFFPVPFFSFFVFSGKAEAGQTS